MIKVLGHHGIADLQFLAFPETVRGGVWVEALQRSGDASPWIIATPIQDTSGGISVFDVDGRLLGRLLGRIDKLLKDHAPPYVIACGDFAGDQGDELAVTSAKLSAGQPSLLTILNVSRKDAASGSVTFEEVQTMSIASLGLGECNLSSLSGDEGERMIFSNASNNSLVILDPRTGEQTKRELSESVDGGRVFPSAFDDQHLLSTLQSEDSASETLAAHTASQIIEIQSDATRVLDVGREENGFCIALAGEYESVFGELKGKDAAKNIHIGHYRHLRMEPWSERYKKPLEGDWAGEAFDAQMKQYDMLEPLDQKPVSMWNPCFTHRQFGLEFSEWAEMIDQDSGMPRHMMQCGRGLVDGFTPGRKSGGLISSTYDPGNEQIQQLYVETLRAFLRSWATVYRQHPERVASLEPNHEHEIAIATDQSVGDYNPGMIEGFYGWLVQMYGKDESAWRQRFGINFDQFFDAPRGLERGRWDQYDLANPYFRAWVDFNRYVVNRTLATTYREALLAGIPPEMIHSHQIPGRYATYPLLEGVSRITPIDYAMTAGVGFGFTKFGVNHIEPVDAARAAKSSGFDGFVMGEFQPLTLDPDLADAELRYVFNHGARGIHVLYWGAQHTEGKVSSDHQQINRVVYDAIQRLVLEDPPRQGMTGGVGQIRNFRGKSEAKNRKYNIVSVGTGEDHRGLIKSIAKDGKTEGTIYCVPFHSHVNVRRLIAKPKSSDQIRFEVSPVEGSNASLVPGSQVEVSYVARSREAADGVNASVIVRVLNQNTELEDLRATLPVVADGIHHRYTLRIPTRIDGLAIEIESDKVECKDLLVTLQSPDVADVYTGKHSGTPHRGGITFDVLD